MSESLVFQEYCTSQAPPIDAGLLPASSAAFLAALGLPRVHPWCQDPSLFDLEGVPLMGPMLQDVHESWMDGLLTDLFMTIPPLWAFAELWVRLLSGMVAPLGTLLLIIEEQHVSFHPVRKETTDRWVTCLCIGSVAASLVVMTDSLYVYEFGTYGITLFLASFMISFRIASHRQLNMTPYILAALALLAFVLVYDWQTLEFHFGKDEEINKSIQAGVYYDSTNPLINQTIAQWPVSQREYQPTPYLYTGDARTGIPYFLNQPADVDWHRVYLTVDDGEVLALDLAFPPTGHNTSQPVYLVLPGVNGGSEEGYVKDLANRRTADNSTVVVMVPRGLMHLPIRGWNIFHGARWSDAHATAVHLSRVLADHQTLAGVGYSMGAIVLANYVASAGTDCALDVAFGISGALECRAEARYERSQRLWQPMIVDYMRENQFLASFGERLRARMTQEQVIAMMRARSVVEVDGIVHIAYNGFGSLDRYYSAMGALGDINNEQLTQSSIDQARICNVSIPLAMLHALDDPISTWRTIVNDHGLMQPDILTHLGSGNLVLLLTQQGGHVGWPIGWWPPAHGWEFMNEAAAGFVAAVDRVRPYN